MNEDDFDQLFDQAFDEAAMKHTVSPDPLVSWDRMTRKLKQHNRRIQRQRSLPVITVAVLLGVIIFGASNLSKAISFILDVDKNNIASTVPTVPVSETNNFGAVIVEQSGAVTQRIYTTWEIASQHIRFSPLLIGYTANRSELLEVRLMFNNKHDKANEALLLYTNADHQRYVLSIRKLCGSIKLASGLHVDKETRETVKLDADTDANVIVFTDQRISLEYDYNGLLITISGEISIEDAVKIAQHIKQPEYAE